MIRFSCARDEPFVVLDIFHPILEEIVEKERGLTSILDK